ncbi:glucans biosynthesis glucosyltransferase MdoH [Albimonas pacifica]|uniref:Glucans biosynthesis glucosyltransferase H n=1 Tax=Albimonas pacifica TaxID=1114924 RepID=A0A1I3H2A0_9RHOB|nr:glucans biosynthesis glucosyltransferase MdoH [Albimonas pacifica]SFI29854.1 membrane glycosyltransferase [Albimonas pacifica]
MTEIATGLPLPSDAPSTTPAGLQQARALTRRRALAAGLNLVSLAAVIWGATQVFGAGGWSATDVVILVCIAVGAPWTLMGAWNAVIGLWLLHGARDGLARAAPHLDVDPDQPIRLRTAVAMTIRNEAPDRALARLAEIRRSLDLTGEGHAYDLFVLSDTTDPEIAAAEEAAMARWRPRLGNAVYRRRSRNDAWKAGNIRDFLRRWGKDYDLFLPLDSDSLMAGEAIVRMTRILQSHPRIGILQSLVVGTPSASAFARIFQFGMRHGMRSFTIGAAWWHGDCGPFWGHNALVRVAPFRAKCAMPRLPGKPPLGGWILSHDQVEAALMRRAGYEVRVIPVEGPSWEDNPPTLLDFTRRDLRWCQGNMQYLKLLALPGLKPMSRFQIFAAIMMYFGAPAWMLMTLAAAAKIVLGEANDVNLAFGLAMFLVMFAMSLVPKVAGWIDVALTPGAIRAYGGAPRFLAGALIETVFSILLAPAAALRVTIFLIGLALGRTVTWNGQERDVHALTLADAVRGLWPQTLFGAGLTALIAASVPGALPWAAPVLAGLTLAIPFALLTASPAVGRALARAGLCAVPEETSRPDTLRALSDAGPSESPRPAVAAA